jgi:tetratricopeptide (TPR) repeat protein
VSERGLRALTDQAQALANAGRRDEAIAAYQAAAREHPTSAVAEHNLAAALGDQHRCQESEAAAGRAFAKGLDAPETWLVLARALQGQARLEEAEGAYRQAVARRPGYADALADRAQLIWMRTGDLAAARAPLDAAIGAQPLDAALRLKRATLLEYAASPAAAFESLADLPAPLRSDPFIRIQMVQLAVGLDPRRALALAHDLARQYPDEGTVLLALCQAELAAGEAVAAMRTGATLVERWPLNQHALGLLATAWRLAGDGRYRALYDYDALIGEYRIDTPPGWSTLESYLGDLARALRALHPFVTHPLGQSLRGGSQTGQSLERSDDPVIRAFFQAIDGPIRRHIAGLGQGDDPLRRRITGAYGFDAVWSVRLRPGGRHADHLHQRGWLSSACYIDLPPAIGWDRQGWIKFGEPGVPTDPALPPERHIKPEPGKLVLFPSYMWHGTVPFEGDAPRLSIAFDVIPA